MLWSLLVICFLMVTHAHHHHSSISAHKKKREDELEDNQLSLEDVLWQLHALSLLIFHLPNFSHIIISRECSKRWSLTGSPMCPAKIMIGSYTKMKKEYISCGQYHPVFYIIRQRQRKACMICLSLCKYTWLMVVSTIRTCKQTKKSQKDLWPIKLWNIVKCTWGK